MPLLRRLWVSLRASLVMVVAVLVSVFFEEVMERTKVGEGEGRGERAVWERIEEIRETPAAQPTPPWWCGGRGVNSDQGK